MNGLSGLGESSKRRRAHALAAALVLAALLSGCVVYPAYYGPPHYYRHYDWR